MLLFIDIYHLNSPFKHLVHHRHSHTLPVGFLVNITKAVQKIFLEITTGEVGLPTLSRLYHRSGYAFKTADGTYLTSQTWGVLTFLIRQDGHQIVGCHRQFVQQTEQFLIQLYQKFRGFIGPLFIEHLLMVIIRLGSPVLEQRVQP